MLHLYHSNRLETLARQFAATLGPVDDPFRAEQVVVQNAGMGRWLCCGWRRRRALPPTCVTCFLPS
ncbi:MAG: exodeoxyribonuclease V subunit gamma [Thiolinea sp.]